MVSANRRRSLTGLAAVVAMLGWLQLAPAFGFPVTAPAGMLDRVFGASREAGAVGWVLLSIGLAAFVAFYFLAVEPRARAPIAPIAFAVGAWLVSGAVVMPLLGVLQGAPATNAAPTDPMRANFLMLNLGPGAGGESLVGWVLFGAVLVGGSKLKVGAREWSIALGAAALAAAAALCMPTLAARGEPDRVVEGQLVTLPAASVFISVLELPQPPGAALLPHPPHIAGFVLSTSGTATMVMDGKVVDVGPGDAVFLPDHVAHDHENRAAVPLAIALLLVVVGLTIAVVLTRGSELAAALMVALLVAGTVATVNPLMNHWYFIGVRDVVMRGALMPVPAGHRTYESENLTGLASGPLLERLTARQLSSGVSAHFVGPAAIVVLDGQISVGVNGKTAGLSAQSGTTIAGGTEATVQSNGAARILVVELLPAD